MTMMMMMHEELANFFLLESSSFVSVGLAGWIYFSFMLKQLFLFFFWVFTRDIRMHGF